LLIRILAGILSTLALEPLNGIYEKHKGTWNDSTISHQVLFLDDRRGRIPSWSRRSNSLTMVRVLPPDSGNQIVVVRRDVELLLLAGQRPQLISLARTLDRPSVVTDVRISTPSRA
jgi:hypothetical protein